MTFICSFFFFFQAEDGIRDLTVTGVQSVLFRSLDLGLRKRRSPVCGTHNESPALLEYSVTEIGRSPDRSPRIPRGRRYVDLLKRRLQKDLTVHHAVLRGAAAEAQAFLTCHPMKSAKAMEYCFFEEFLQGRCHVL